MKGQVGTMQAGKVAVATTSGTGLTPEYWADRCLEKIIWVGQDSHPLVMQQAEAFKEQIRGVIVAYMKNAIKSDRTTLYNEFANQGELPMAEILRRL